MADKTQIIDAIEALAVHCRPPIMTVEDKARWMRDWCNDLAEYPMDAIGNACRKWRHSGSTKFPTAGQLLPMIREFAPVDRGPEVGIWRELSEAEYDQLSLRDKIRHRQILAHNARAEAGPMFRNTTKGARISGVHLEAEEMPGAWAKWNEVARGHEAECARLRSFLYSQQPAIAAE